ncbi:hypothetical protein [Pseudonocardia xishanensis]|uniref:2-polyprenyl-6-methoxyphenol hydroxylase-like FAD-dependent oxidoreductase n=1 Tax=Pseudonocardia xishanensis TaxID=630995 RepID=A0ABP8S048_9PSEU
MNRIVIVGGSIAGSLAAAAASRHADEVVVLERDELPNEPVVRRGVPHGGQFHALLARGLAAIETLVPGFEQDALAAGCHRICVTRDIANHKRYGWAARPDSDITNILASRPMIEHLVRARVRALPGVVFREGVRVEGLVAGDNGHIAGVRTEGGVIAADLVVDASGRSSATPQWLVELGHPAPEETEVDARWGYASCQARRPPGVHFGFEALSALPLGVTASGTPRTRGVAMWRQEGDDRWIVTAVGSAGDHPPSDAEGFRAFLASLPYPEVATTLDALELELPARVWRRTVNRMRHYDHLSAPPAGLVVLGDAVAAFNPVYGQGMTVAALEALDLRAELEAHAAHGGPAAEHLPRCFHERVARTVGYCWELSTGADYRVEGVIGAGPPPDAVERRAFMDRVEGLSSEDPAVLVQLLETTQLIRTPEWLAEPGLRTRVRQDWDRLGRLVDAPA